MKFLSLTEPFRGEPLKALLLWLYSVDAENLNF